MNVIVNDKFDVANSDKFLLQEARYIIASILRDSVVRPEVDKMAREFLDKLNDRG